MANEPTHVIVPVLHPESGEIHAIAVPPDVPVADLHAALSDYEHPALNDHLAQSQPTEQGALENSPAFKKAAADAWADTAYGKIPEERGFMVSNSGDIGGKTRAEVSAELGGKMNITISPDSFASFHTHPDGLPLTKNLTPKPSVPDKNVAYDNRLNVYVMSREGLYLADPSGQLHKIYDSPSDVGNPKKKATDRIVK
jgi:hypothetical protein